MIDRTLPALIAIPVTVTVIVGSRRRGLPAGSILARSAFAIYLTALFTVVFFPIPTTSFGDDTRGILASNLVPFRTVLLLWRAELSRQIVRQLGGNLLLFVPLGYFLPLLFPTLRRLRATLLSAALITVGIETMQLVISLIIGAFYRSFDVDDVWLNLAGAWIGYGVYGFHRRLFSGSAVPSSR
jgi:glycopeptide antibiotics resistance protein